MNVDALRKLRLLNPRGDAAFAAYPDPNYAGLVTARGFVRSSHCACGSHPAESGSPMSWWPLPEEEVFTCVEIMSPDDTMSSMQDRLDDYLRFGVPNIWVVDSWKQRGWNVTSDGWRWRPMASCVPPMAEPPCPDRRAASLSTRLQKFAHVFRSRKALADSRGSNLRRTPYLPRTPLDRHRGGGRPPTPATPPCVRVRTRRFEKLRRYSSTSEGRPSDLK
jgi:hypothetical protein